LKTDPVFTVFTPTYNRAHTLSRVYNSLCRQSYSDFEWLIVDDGSSDGTRGLVEGWAATAPFLVRYIFQENRGKHVAFNRGVTAARGEFFLAIDSDDELTPVALERFKWHWDQIPSASRAGFTGVTGLCVDQAGKLHGTSFPRDVTDSDSREIRYVHRVKGEKCGFHRTEILRRHPFPEVEGATFVPEDIVWFSIARSYKTRFVNDVMRIYWHTEAAGAQLSSARLTRKGAEAAALVSRWVLNNDLSYFWHAPASLLYAGALFSRFSFDAGIGVFRQRLQLGTAAQLVWLLSLPLGFSESLWDRWRHPGLQPPPDPAH
jgi:glycosyltransferase involved in cell wall biosynthesis